MNDLVLPAALQPWQHWLQQFDPQIAVALGEMVRQIDALTGASNALTARQEPGEPDGLGQLATRGPYDRLLSSEWLLADEAPDEFIRRAAMGEHLFLAPQPKVKRVDRLIIALFDVGPLQLGAPRLVHIALWIVLARRAAQADARLLWGVLQMPGKLAQAGQLKDLAALLRLRTWALVTDQDRTAWDVYLQTLQAPGVECWCMTARSQPQLEQISHMLHIGRALAQDAAEVAFKTRRTQRQTSVALPPEPIAGRLLKGQFDPRARPARQRTTEARLSLKSAPLISPSGNHVAVRLLDEPGVIVFPVPRGPQDTPGKPRKQRWPAGAEPLALAFSGKLVGGVLRQQDATVHWQMPQVPIPPDVVLAPPGTAALLHAAWLKQGKQQRLFVLTSKAELMMASTCADAPADDHAARPLESKARDVLAISPMSATVLSMAQRSSGRVQVERLGFERERSPVDVCAATADTRVLLSNGHFRGFRFPGCAVCSAQGTPHESWMLYLPTPTPSRGIDQLEVNLPAGWIAIGLHFSHAGGPMLLALGPRRDVLALHDGKNLETLHTLASPVVRHHFSIPTAQVAMLTEQRQLIVYAAATRAVKLFIQGGDDATAA
ncbi:hypothetical protein [Amantichitinum ursilacus]|uniref:Uncharacterized protein n=1 Tax=Amantichitinum ursilacus TaxID=857265 RepID=A0A0N1JT72_9NEIS|nr:hypothetical protein [Amantichitinum ursilacus]KPC53758.1 hypothetical protein WG78_07940 [Amantichitinum ursilacus]